MERRAVVYTVDGDMGCILQMEDSIRSVRRMLGDIDVVVCTNRPDAGFDTKCGQRVVDVSKVVDEFGLAHTGVMWRRRECSPMLLFRLALPLVPELDAYDKVLYLDSDTEVWSPDAARLFDFDTEGHEATAVRDSLGNHRVWSRVNRVKLAAPTEGYPHFQRWDYLLETKSYVNSGVVVFDLKRLRDGYRERFRRIVEELKARKPPYPDQDMLNAYFDIFLVTDRAFNDWSRGAYGCIIRHNVGGVRRATKFYPPEHGARPVDALCRIEPREACGVLSGRVDRVVALSDRRDAARSRAFLGSLEASYGVKDPDVVWYERDPFLDFLPKAIPSERGIGRADMALWHAHYRAVKGAYDGGAEGVAVFEDTWDVASAGGEAVHALAQTLPVEYSLAVWDAEATDGAGGWHCLHWHRGSAKARSAKFYMMSRKCMKTYLWLFESLLDDRTPYRMLRVAHHWFDDSLRGKQRLFFRTK